VVCCEFGLSKPRLLAARHPARPRCVGPRRKSGRPSSSRCEFLAGAGAKTPPSGLPAPARSGTFPPNYSFKRTVQSLRDWSCRLTHALDDMQKRQIAIGFTILLAFAAALYFLLSFIAKWVEGLNPNVSAALVTASIGLVGLWYAQWHTRTREIAESHRQTKIEVYNTFFDIVERFQDESAESIIEKKEDLSPELRRDFKRFHRGLIIWGSPGVIKAWLHFRKIAGKKDAKVLVAVDQMFQAIRKDLGNSNFGLQSGDLLKSMLSDPESWRD
jgi:hypothetical protein